MRDIPFTGEFDGTYNVFTSFGYLETDEEDQKVLTAVGRALKTGSPFLLELMGRDSLMRIFRPRDLVRVRKRGEGPGAPGVRRPGRQDQYPSDQSLPRWPA